MCPAFADVGNTSRSLDESAFAILQSDISNYLQADPSNVTANHAPTYNTSSSSFSSDLPPYIAKLRRPETKDPRDFWFCSPAKWNLWLEQVASNANKRTASSAVVGLRGYHIAGLLMETDEGMDAENPCRACARQTKYTPCRVYANKSSTRCAYCINKHKSHCGSGPDPSPPRKRMRMDSEPTKPRERRNVLPQHKRAAPQTVPNRKPESIDPSDFWYVSEEKWSAWERQAAGGSGNALSNSARASMRLSSRAGIVMESEDSLLSDPPCALCERTGTVCKVGAGESGKTCAYCCLRRVKCSNVVPQSVPDVQEVDRPRKRRSWKDQPPAPSVSMMPEAATKFRRPQSRDPSDFWYCSVQRWDELHASYASAIADGRESAYRVLQLIDKAGRLMETPEGADSDAKCLSCEIAGERCRFSAVGRKANERCAFCKLKYKKCDLPTARRDGSGEDMNMDISSRGGSLLIRSDVPHAGGKKERLEDEVASSMPASAVSASVSAIQDQEVGHVSTQDTVGRLIATVTMLQQQVKDLQTRDSAREMELQRQSKRVKLMAQNFQRVGADLSRGWKRFLRDEFPDDEDDDEGVA